MGRQDKTVSDQSSRISEVEKYAHEKFTHPSIEPAVSGSLAHRPPTPSLNRQLVIILIFFVMLISIPTLCLTNIMNDMKILKARGVNATAHITKKWISNEPSNGLKRYLIYYYFYVSANRGEVSGLGQTNQEDYDSVVVGGPVPVIYDPMSPSRHALNFNDEMHKLP